MGRFLVAIALIVAGTVAGCDGNGPPQSSPGRQVIVDGWVYATAAPLPAGAIAVRIEVEAPLTDIPPGAGMACPEALSQATIEYRRGDAVPVRYRSAGGQLIRWIWQFGFSARDVGGRLEIVAPDGSVYGRDGDALAVGGGATGPDDAFHVCDVRYLPTPIGAG